MTIGEKIALLRNEKSITQTALAEYLCVTPQTVSRWEVGSGAPEITLLPRIAAFFGVSIDELFGVTDLERAADLVCKYSVLRDDRSFQEAMDCVNSQIQTVDALLRNGKEDAAKLETQRDRLEAEKLHLWIQLGRESFQRALKIANEFVEKTDGNPEHPWYLRMRLQRNQLLAGTGRGREALTACKKDFTDAPDESTLLIYLTTLLELQRYEEILSAVETDPQARDIVFPVSEKNLGIWWMLIDAAAETGGRNFIETYLPSILETGTEADEFDFLKILLPFYRKEGQEEKLAAAKKRLLTLLPVKAFNKYFEERARQEIEQG